MFLRCASSSDTVPEIEYQILHLNDAEQSCYQRPSRNRGCGTAGMPCSLAVVWTGLDVERLGLGGSQQ